MYQSTNAKPPVLYWLLSLVFTDREEADDTVGWTEGHRIHGTRQNL